MSNVALSNVVSRDKEVIRVSEDPSPTSFQNSILRCGVCWALGIRTGPHPLICPGGAFEQGNQGGPGSSSALCVGRSPKRISGNTHLLPTEGISWFLKEIEELAHGKGLERGDQQVTTGHMSGCQEGHYRCKTVSQMSVLVEAKGRKNLSS